MEPRDIYNSEDWGRVVRELRRERGWTQARLGEWLGVSRPTVVKLEAGGRIGIDLALRALTILGAVPTVHLKGTRLVVAQRQE